MVPTLAIPPFLQVANHVALELVNTVNGRPDWTVDYLTSPAHVAAWAAQLHLAGPTDAHRLAYASSGTDFDAIIDLREVLYSTFARTCRGRTPDTNDLGQLFDIQREGLAQAEWRLGAGQLTPTWADRSLRSLRHRIAHEAVQLLLVGDLSRTRACVGCGWLFLDTSKSSARKWCTMNLCGAKDKMRRYRGNE